MTIEIREARSDEHAQAGAVTADAYREFAHEGDPDWQEYLVRLADVADRASRTTILVAVEDGRILGTATLELDGRTEQDDDPLRPHESHIRMLGVAPGRPRARVGRMMMEACEERASGIRDERSSPSTRRSGCAPLSGCTSRWATRVARIACSPTASCCCRTRSS